MNIFYVYEHWRPDKDEPFWVGKGHDSRAYDFRRNSHYNNIVAKLSRLGMCVEVRMVESGMPEHEAFALETVRIRFWRSRGIKLANLTDGGEGMSGYNPSKETRAKISAFHKGKKRSEETRAKMRAAITEEDKQRRRALMIVRVQKPFTEEQKAKIRLKRKLQVFSPESNEKRSAKLKGRPKTIEHRLKISAARIGIKLGPQSAEQRARTSAAVKGKGGKYVRTPEIREKTRLKLLGRKNGPISEETRAKISVSLRGKPRRPTTLGTRSINNGQINKRILKELPLPVGWVYGLLRETRRPRVDL